MTNWKAGTPVHKDYTLSPSTEDELLGEDGLDPHSQSFQRELELRQEARHSRSQPSSEAETQPDVPLGAGRLVVDKHRSGMATGSQESFSGMFSRAYTRGDPMGTSIFVRAFDPVQDRWRSVDILELERESLLAWLRSRGGDNRMAEDVVGILLGHGHLHGTTSKP